MSEKKLTVEQVAQVIAANRLLPDPPGGFDMQGITDELNDLLAAPASAGEDRFERICGDCGSGYTGQDHTCEPAIQVEPIKGAALAEFIHEYGGERLSREMTASQPRCVDCDEAAKHAHSDATTPGFFYDRCSKHRRPPAVEEKL